MLSIGNQPSDPLCASDTPPLHRGNSSHDRPSPSPPKHELPFSDLTTSKPNFSIRSFFGPDPAIEVASCPHGGVLTFTPSFPSRNYVFTARSKDISSNWPFSSRNLQLCVKHGVKDPLPPFESSPGCTVEALDKKKHLIIINPCTEEGPSKARNINEELTEKEKRTNVPQHETQSVPTKKQCLPVTVAVPDSLQPYSGARLLGKKSKVILKLGGLSDRISTEDITSNSTVVSEAMASKICPVCKTFSSSSNTTLNAHIDQCLCEDSTPKWTASTKLGRNRIKPRRTRLMVDIYVTANHCTVEELERRNGRIWVGAASLSCPDQDSDPEPSEEKMHEISALNDVDEGCSGGGIGAVYIDSSGKKVRILSKSVGADQPRGVEGLGLRKPLKCAKKSKIPALKKKRGKADKFLKLASQTHKTRVSKDFDDQEIHHEPRGGSKYLRTCNSRPQRPMVHKESGTLKRWVCSKRSGLFKKVSHRDCHGQNSNSVEDESERFNKQKTFNSFEHLEDTMRMKDSMSNLQNIGIKNPFPGKRKIGSSSTGFPPSKKSHVLDSFKPPRNSSRTLKALRFYRLNKESLVSGRDSKMRMVTDLDLSGERPSTSDEIGSETGDKTTFMRLDKADESSDDTSDLSGKHDDVESTGTEFHDDSYTEESFGMATEQTSPNFSSYLNQGNLKQLYKRGSLGCVEKPPSPNFTTFADGEDSYSEDLRDDMDVNKDDVEDREYEVERIPIPGPPGSFLPSPRALGSEDFHGTSSLTTSRVLSSQERVDNDSSDSPISATSTISNPGPTAASTVKYIDPLGVTEHKSFGPNSELELSGAKVISAQQPTPSVSSEKGGNFRAGNGKSAWVPRRNDEPCCCQRKERNNPCVVLNYQESQLLRRRNASSLSTTIGTGNRVPDHLENDASRSSTTPPTPTNPVLRLMGKNLVLNKEGESLPQPELTILENFPASRVFNVSCSSGDYLAPRPEFYSLPPDNFTEAQGNSQFMKATNQHSRSMVVPNSSKEIITIDDSTDTEPDIRADLARQIGGRSWRDDNPVADAQRFSFPYDPRVETHFPFSYKVQEPSFFGQFPGDQLRRLGSGLMNARWCSPPVVSTLQQMPPSSSTSAATRSPLPFSRRLF